MNVANRKADPKVLEQLRANRTRRRMEAAIVAKAAEPPRQTPITGKLCVGSIFTNGEELCQKWFDLQLRYLKASTDVDFKHISVIQKGSVPPIFANNSEILRPPKEPGTNSQAHVCGLNVLRDHFVTQVNDCEYFLFIDMDAFPIRKGWFSLLTAKLKAYEIAVALRPENLEQRLHSSILLAKREVVPSLVWGVSKVGQDLIGGNEADVHLISHQAGAKRNQSFVLLRSNKHQIHPLLCGIYYDLFYHHCCGSGRNFNMRARPYWEHMASSKFDVMKTIEDLFADPNKFIGGLGWDESEYAQV